MAASFASVSSHSASGAEPATMPAPATSPGPAAVERGASQGDRPVAVAAGVDPSDRPGVEAPVEPFELGDGDDGGLHGHASDRRRGMQEGGHVEGRQRRVAQPAPVVGPCGR